MARASLIQTNFTGGELSPALALGRVDIAKYNNGVRRLENCLLTVQGGAKRRPGTRYITPVRTESKRARLIEFVYNRGQAYLLEMGEGYMRFFRDRALLAAEVGTPYSEAQLPSVNFVQKADTAFFVHEAAYPQRLQRFSDLAWGFGNTPFITEPFEEQGHFPGTTLTLSQVTPGAATATAGAPFFFLSDIGRHIQHAGGSALVTGWISNTVVNIQISTTFPAMVIGSGTWNLTGSPQDDLAPSGKGKVGQVIALNANFVYYETAKNITGFIGGAGSALITCSAHGYVVGDTVYVSVGGYGGAHPVAAVVDSNTFAIFIDGVNGLLSTTGSVKRQLQSDGSEIWRGEDVGKIVAINGGLVRIEQVFSSSSANGRVLRELNADVPAGANAWTLESPAWGGIKGFPRAVTINGQRLLFAGSPGYPQHLWASAIQEYLNFEFGTADDQAFRFPLDGPRNSPIRHLAPARKLMVLTEADEMSVKGGQEKPITPTNIEKTDESTVGANSVRPLKIGSELLFVQAAGRKINACGYRYEIDGFASPDRTVFASHITSGGVWQMAHQKDPDPTLYAVRGDGQLAVCAYDIDQEVTGWGRWITQGAFESVATVPTATGEDAYAIVKRTVNGATRRYVEVFDPEMLVDCGISGWNPAGQATWGGLDHLENEMVVAWADGAHMGEFRVTGGQITLQRDAINVQIGLAFTPLVEPLQVEVGGNGTTAQGAQVHLNEAILRVLDTSAAVINGEPVEFRRFGPELLDQPPPEYSGDVRRTQLTDQIFKTQLVITQPYPLPFHLLDIIRRVTINEG